MVSSPTTEASALLLRARKAGPSPPAPALPFRPKLSVPHGHPSTSHVPPARDRPRAPAGSPTALRLESAVRKRGGRAATCPSSRDPDVIETLQGIDHGTSEAIWCLGGSDGPGHDVDVLLFQQGGEKRALISAPRRIVSVEEPADQHVRFARATMVRAPAQALQFLVWKHACDVVEGGPQRKAALAQFTSSF